MQFYRFYGQNKTATECAAAVSKFRGAGKLDDMWSKLTAKYGPEPDPDVARLMNFYNHYGQSKTAEECTTAVNKFRGAGKIDDMWSKLIAKYGPEPT